MGEHNNVLSAAHPVSAREVKLRSAACRAFACHAPPVHAVLLLQVTCRLLAPSQNSLPPSQAIHAKADDRDGAAVRFLAAALAGLALLVIWGGYRGC